MATLKQLKTNFVAGELGPLMLGRPDLRHYHNAARRMRNVVAIPQGGFSTRPGSKYLADFANGNVRFASFQYTTTEAYLFVFVHQRVHIFYEGEKVAELTTPWTSTHLVAQFAASGEMLSSGINWTQNLDQMVVYHEAVTPRIIKRGASHSAWTITTAVFENMPRVDFGETYTNGVDEVQRIHFPQKSDFSWLDGDTFTLILEDEETSNIVHTGYTGNSGTMASRVQAALRALPNVDGAGITVVSTNPSANNTNADLIVTFSGKDGQRPWGVMSYRVISAIEAPQISISVETRGQYPGENALSNARGWPRCGVFYQGRHWMAGSKSLPNTVFATRAGTDWDLNNKKSTDDYGFMYSADTDDVPVFLNIYPGRHLQLFSTVGEFYVPVSDREGITPTNMALRRTTSRGMKAGTRVVEVDGATGFIQSGGKALREFIYADTEAAYQANSISLLASHLMRDPIALSMRRASSTDDADLVFMPNPDGTMTVLCTLRTQEVNAFTLWETQGAYLDACAVYDKVYVAVRRTINGETKIYVEELDPGMPVDCGKAVGAVSSTTAAWLANTEVAIVLDGSVQQSKTADGSGVITFDREAEASGYIGLPWPEVAPDEYPGYRWLVETLPVDADLQDGTMFGRKRRVVWVAFRMHNTNGLIVNGSRQAMRRYGANLLDKPEPYVSGIRNLKGLLGWDYEGKVVFGETEPTRATVLALSWAVSV